MNSTDNLTGVLDRTTFFALLEKIINQANVYKTKVALLIVDIDRFYKINGSFGYDAGDTILKKFSELLRHVARDQDYVARIGDNRFALILTGVMNIGHAELAAHKIQRLLESPFSYADREIQLDCTIAISLCPLHASNHIFLVKECESILHEAKESKIKINVSKLAEEDEISDDWDIELELDGALQNDQLQIFYQPKVSLDSGGVVGAEALLRWEHPIRGFIQPDYFIPLAERLGHMNSITNWILNTVVRHSSEWTQRWGTLSVSVNIAPDYILNADLKNQISNAMKLWSNDNVSLTLEIVERSLVLEPERSFTILKELQEMGVHISIDDFGTGYSSLSYFENLPVDELKIDQSFVKNIVSNKTDQKLVKLIIDLAHAFDMEVVAEGVEYDVQVKHLKNYQCDIVQGYLFAKPMAHEEYKKWIEDFSGVR